MESTDSSSSQATPPPKRFGAVGGRRRTLFMVVALLLVNGGIVHTLARQVAVKTTPEETQVKDETTSLIAVGEISDDHAAEESIVEDQQLVITTYIVKKGDTLSGIAEKFNISINTIRWANNLTGKATIKPGDDLVILPVSGLEYTVKKGDTLSGIAAKFDASQDDILTYNDVEANAIKVGTKLIIPGAEPIPAPVKAPVKKAAPKQTSTTTAQKTESPTSDTQEKKEGGQPETTPKFINPIPGGVLTQGVHDGNAVDFGAAIGTSIRAAAAGKVIVAKGSGYNGGYGSMIVINHSNGCQTQYSHLSTVSVSVGDEVDQGETIGRSGNSGRSTGPHLHYNERGCGTKNTFAKYKKGTKL